jgi:DHA2 family multidrug resistance protein
VTCLSLGMFAFFGGVVVLPSWLQQVMQYNATWAGYAVAPVGVLALVMAPIIGVVQNRFDLRLLNTIGFVIFAACSFWMATLSIDVPYREIALQRLVMGAGIALFFVPVNQIILAGLDDKDVASASGLSNFFRTLASSVATAVSTTLYDHRTTFHHAVLAEHTHAGARTTEQYLQWMGRMGLPTPARHAALNEMVNAQAATLAVNDIFWLYGIIFLAIMGLIWFAKPPFASGAQPAG